MRHYIAVLFLAVLPLIAKAASLSPDEATALIATTERIKVAFDERDIPTIMAMTHPSIYKLTNGKDGFEAITRQAFVQIDSAGVRFLDSKLGTPSEIYSCGEEQVCFIPRTSTLEVDGKKARSIGFMIAIRSVKGGYWLFLDGSGLRKNPGLLKMLLPDLPPDTPLPDNRVELIKEG
jgi:hypothetical protein